MDTSIVRNLASGLLAVGVWLLAAPSMAGGEIAPVRIPPGEIPWPESAGPVEGTGMRAGLQVLVVAGDAKGDGLYTMMFKLPPNRRVAPHAHPDVRSCFVLAGTFYFAYGATWDETLLQPLPAGSHYTEPAGMNHFGASRDETVIAECTAVGPTGTTFVNPADDPRRQQ
jgi:quercetin dioxygenase-like cupin family protein